MFDTYKFLTDNWPNADELLKFAHNYGCSHLKRQTAYKWFERKSVPSDWLPILLALMELDQGKPISLAKYLK